MKLVQKYNTTNTKQVPTKGARLNWQPLREVQPVYLTPEMTKGKVVVTKPSANSQGKHHFLVP